LIERGETAADKRRYQTALTAYRKATAKLKAVPPLLRDDLKRAETLTGARISPQAGERYDGYDYLLPVETTAEAVSVLGWVDGDTVETSAGRVRLIGIDTPELKDQCSRAQWAKQYSESLAPVGSTITLTNPKSVKNTDRYDRLLRYVDIRPADGGGDNVIDVGYSLIKSSLAVSRYDSRDGYQWHPRERLYRKSSDGAVEESGGCRRNAEKAAFILVSTLSKDKDSPEYWHKRILGKILLAPYRSAKKHLPNAVAETRKEDEEQDRLEREEQQYSDNTDDDSDDDGGGGADPGYNGPRCYAPGGKTWKPC
jgi:endonuclease YncB( thermonuclease family)